MPSCRTAWHCVLAPTGPIAAPRVRRHEGDHLLEPSTGLIRVNTCWHRIDLRSFGLCRAVLGWRYMPAGGRWVGTDEAMTNGRAYCERVSADGAADEIRVLAGTRFDPGVIAARVNPRDSGGLTTDG